MKDETLEDWHMMLLTAYGHVLVVLRDFWDWLTYLVRNGL
jgi:hypothetical protein